jgi:uncharacterized protein YdaU (DUF1376 family)
MNHYPHHLGDYAKDTMGLTMLEHGAYRLLIDAYYATEEAPAQEDVYTIAKAGTPQERKAVDKVLRKFDLMDGRYYHKRIEEELKAYRARSKQATENIRKRYERPTEPLPAVGSQSVPDSVLLASNQEPINPKPTTTVVAETTAPPRPPAGGGEPEELQTPEPDSRAHELASVCAMNRVSGAAFNGPYVAQWLRDGVTAAQIREAITQARATGKPDPETIPIKYLLPIVERVRSGRDQTPDTGWRRDEKRAVAKGRELGINPRAGEELPDFVHRVDQALQQRARSQVQ